MRSPRREGDPTRCSSPENGKAPAADRGGHTARSELRRYGLVGRPVAAGFTSRIESIRIWTMYA